MCQEEKYSSPADMWSLGAVVSFLCNERHLFTSVASVVGWRGGQSPIDSGKYSIDLRQLVADLLSPNATRRLTAPLRIHNACNMHNRQRHDL